MIIEIVLSNAPSHPQDAALVSTNSSLKVAFKSCSLFANLPWNLVWTALLKMLKC